MKQALRVTGVTILLVSGSLWGQQWRDWTGASNNYTILYRYRVLNGKACDMEFKDENQGDGYTTFDASVDYQTSTSAPHSNDPHNPAPDTSTVTKTNSVHVVTAINHNGVAQVSNCYGIGEVRVSFVQRQR